MRWLFWVPIVILGLMVLVANPWFWRWYFNRTWDRAEGKRWREKFMRGGKP